MAKGTSDNSSEGYVRGLVDELLRLRPLTLSRTRAEHIHRLRVTTRRLGAVLELSPKLGVRQRQAMKKGLKKMRRRLGELRDIDVMLGQLKEEAESHPLVSAWLEKRLKEERMAAQRKLRRKGLNVGVERGLAKVAAVWRGDCAGPYFAEFCRSADAVMMGKGEVDVHAVRIAGKRLRYRLELAAASGLIGDSTQKRLKGMQDALGEWHDRVVLAEYALNAAVEENVALSNAALLRRMLEFVGELMNSADARIEEFTRIWREERVEICEMMGKLGRVKERTDAALPGAARKGAKGRQGSAAAADASGDRGSEGGGGVARADAGAGAGDLA